MAKVTGHTRRQGQRLRQLRERLGLSQALVADRLSFKTTQGVDLYERGISILRLDMVPAWAAAFGITEQDFVSAVLGDLPDESWTFRGALRGRVPDWIIEKMAPTWEGRPLLNQQAAVEAILEMVAEERTNVTKPARHSNAS